MEAIISTFLDECSELLELFEQAALRLEQDAGDAAAVGELFRAAHTIKGSAGLFGFDAVVEFTHGVETLLDGMRAGEVSVDGARVALLLEAKDHIADLVQATADGSDLAPLSDGGNELSRRLRDSAVAGADVSGEADEASETSAPAENPCWHISVRFGGDSLRNGFDPMSFVRYLSTLGEIEHLSTVTDALPELTEMDPEASYLGFEMDLLSSVSRQDIESAFEFVRDDSLLRIVAPRAALQEYLELIDTYENDDRVRLGEILVASGSLSQSELDRALDLQNASDPAPKLGDLLVEQTGTDPRLVEAALKRQDRLRGRQGGSVRVDAEKLDRLINLVGELVIATASAKLAARQSSDNSVVEPTEAVSGFVEELRESALRLRMVQIGDTFSKFRRVVRDVSAELEKDIRLEISGGDTELDKAVVEKIADPLTHLVRNAIDHGIEDVHTRMQRGKSPQGTLRLDAYHDSGNVVVEITDDGGGLDLNAIRSRAVERGLLEQDANPSESELADLIFHPGFSTKQQVSDLSGRGVGMDVVRRNVEALRGTVEIAARPGQGTSVRIRLPLTLAIIEGFLVGVGGASYVIPLDAVSECVELERRAVASGDRNFINLRGEVLPLLRLGDTFAVAGHGQKRANVVVVQSGANKAGLVVDRLLGEFQTVIKPMGRLFRHAHGISGSTVLGSGEVALILDVAALVQHCTATEAQAVGGRPVAARVSA